MTNKVLYSILFSAVVLSGVTIAGLIVRKFLFAAFQRWARKTETPIDDMVLASLKGPSLLWSVAIGLYVAIGTSELAPKYIEIAFKALHVLVILSVTMVLANLSSKLLTYGIQKTDIPIPVSGLSHAVIKGVVIAVGVMILLGNLGISITPLLTALGVGGLAVALALQDTLSNLFAGIHILAEKSVRIGDYVRLEGGQEGHVMDIGWRTTKILLPPNNMVIVPNGKLAQSILTNYSIPKKEMALRIPFSTGYGEDPQRVEQMVVEEALQAAHDLPDLLTNPAPVVRLMPGFGESSLDFTLICHVVDFEAQAPVQHELRKRILARFKQEGVDIPFPQRIIQMRGPNPL